MDLVTIVAVVLSLLVGALVGWVVCAARKARELQEALQAVPERDIAIRERERASGDLADVRARLEIEQKSRVEADTRREAVEQQLIGQTQWISAQKEQLSGTFATLSNTALASAVEQLLQVVKPHLDGNKGEIVSTLDTKKVEFESMLAPMKTMLEQYQLELKTSETQRNQGYSAIAQQIQSLLAATEATRKETSRVASALSNPKVSGVWGEQALQRCVELAGMSEYCDFVTQETFETSEKKKIRPDLIIKLPNQRVIAVDAKAPTTVYMEAASETDEKKQAELFAVHAKNLRRHIDSLSAKDYHENIGEALDLTVLFLGGEQLLYSALMADPSLFEYGAEKRVFIATPTVLVPLLRVVAAAWRAERTEESARKALELGSELYERFSKVFREIEAVGSALGSATERYNAAIRSIDTRLMPKARDLQLHVSSSKDLPDLRLIDTGVAESTKLSMKILVET